jgi:hypothetical protein
LVREKRIKITLLFVTFLHFTPIEIALLDANNIVTVVLLTTMSLHYVVSNMVLLNFFGGALVSIVALISTN